MRVIALAVLLAACTSDEDGGTADAGRGGSDAASELVGPCARDAEVPVSGPRTLVRGGMDREYMLHVPSEYDRAPTALVLNFHGFTSSPEQQEYFSIMSQVADREGFAVVYPKGTGVPSSFNAGTCCGSATLDGVDDVGFTAALLDEVAGELCLDPRRVYSTGLSNGGFMSYRLACDLSDRIAAIAPVAGVMAVADCEPSRAVPVLHFHGTADTLVPIDGGGVGDFPSVGETVDDWADRNACTGDPETRFEEGDALCQGWDACGEGSAVELCVIDGGGHTWPGGRVPAVAGKTSRDLVASDRMWEFFRDHPMAGQ